MLGYWNEPEATGRAIRDGWLYHGRSGAVSTTTASSRSSIAKKI